MKRLVALLLIATAVTGCGSGDEQDTLTVFAAASLQESFTELAEVFEEEHGAEVDFNFGPSSGLAEQINSGAPADVFASASTRTMESVEEKGEAQTFAVNTMQIAVPADNPAGVASLDDLADPDVKVALCQSAVPCGVVGRQVLDNAGVELTPVSEETDVKAVLTKVSLGEVDAGIVYVTDVRAAGEDVLGVDVPDDVNATTDYPIATITDHELAGDWVAWVLSEEGQEVLADYGFRAAN